MYLSGAIWKRTNIDIMQCDRVHLFFAKQKVSNIVIIFFQVNKDLFMSN